MTEDLLALGTPPQKTRVVVAMSGGVDSSVVAALLAEAGYDVVGITLQLYQQKETTTRSKTCCAGIDIYDAKRTAEKIGIPHYVLDYESRFKASVIDTFADSYIRGETPVPCVRCNQTVKFEDLLTMAKNLGGAALATGHYIQWRRGPDGPEMHRGADAARDPSYFLFTTTKAQLDFLRFPLGGWSKDETRHHARRFDLDVANKKDSQDICFVPDGDYAGLVAKLRPGALEAGNIVHINGTVLGQHQGIIGFTVGQRRGLNLPSPDGHPLYVVRLNPDRHEVIVGPKSALAKTRLTLYDVNWLGDSDVMETDLDVKIRSSQDPVGAHLRRDSVGRGTVMLDGPEYGISPGQACVFYRGSRVLGGGWIARSEDGVAG